MPNEEEHGVRVIETTLLEDFGMVDREVVRRGLLAERGITNVFDGPGDHSLSIEYDPAIIAGEKLTLTLSRHGVCPGAVPSPPDLEGRDGWIETLRDGRRVLIRPIRPSDVARNEQFIAKLSPPSKHYLFLGGITQLSSAALRRLCDPDYAHDAAYIALALGARGEAREQVGVCRYAGADPINGAEISVAVADGWQHQGLGKILLRHLIDYARAHGVARLYSMDARDNQRMRRLARDVGFSEHADRDDIHQVIYSLDLQRAKSARS
jgi:GNAT superfamily N-acetyltransferase